MTRPGLLAVLALLAALVPAGAASAASSDYVVVLEDRVTDPDAATDGLERERGFRAGHRYGKAVKGFAARLSDAQVERLRESPDVAYVTPDVALEGHDHTPLETRETAPDGIRRVRAATATHAHGASTAAVAVIDTGLDLSHPDLDAVSGINCVTPGKRAKDDNGHGTHVGGTIAARNSGSGVVGVAPGTRLYAVKVLDRRSSGTLANLICGLDWVAEHAEKLGIGAANMSIGGPGAADADCGASNDDAQHAAVCAVVAAGVTLVASAGNSDTPITGVVPASYPEVLTVAGMTDTDGLPGGRGPEACVDGEVDDTRWSGSNYASTAAEAEHMIAAPATCVVSSKRGAGVTTMTGTSMAAPHVTGAVARCLGVGGAPGPCAGLTPAQIIARVRADAAANAASFGYAGDPLRPLADMVFGDLVTGAY